MPAHTGARSTGRLAPGARPTTLADTPAMTGPGRQGQRGWERELRFTYRRETGGVVDSPQGTRYTT